MVREYGFSHRLWRWLERFRFNDDPFAVYEADQERPYLHDIFVDRPYLHHVLGDPTRPQAAFLMAGRGDGKTATREMVAYECTHAQLRRRALAVRYYDFGPLLEQVDGDLTQLNARHYVNTIVRFALKTLAEDVPPTYFDLLGEMQRTLLMGYAEAFADPISRLKLGRIVSDGPIQLNWETLSPLETLEALAELITGLGQSAESRYQALYVLVDRVDETAAGTAAAVPLLKPLVSEGPLLETEHMAFKFFLPIEVGEQLRLTVNLRPDRLCVRTITWDEAALRELIRQRLSFYSGDRVKNLEDLLTPAAKTNSMKRLIGACEGSPRTLLRLCRALIHHHVANADETKTLITHTELVDTLGDFEHQLQIERVIPAPAAAARSAPTAPIAPPGSGLYLDVNGHVWIDGERLAAPLSQLEFRLLEALYKQAPEIVSHDVLIETVWPSSAWMSDEIQPGADEQNLRKLIARLRNRLEPEATRGSRFINNVRGRGYWLNTS